MAYQCFYCENDIQHEELHMVSFFKEDHELEETLCDTCYSEWLEGIKE
jgi:hypothetical protein